MDPVSLRDMFKCTIKECGEQSVTMIGLLMMPVWLADRWVLLMLFLSNKDTSQDKLSDY